MFELRGIRYSLKFRILNNEIGNKSFMQSNVNITVYCTRDEETSVFFVIGGEIGASPTEADA